MELEGKSAVVTGGAGFIGSTLCEQLVRLGCRVVGLDNFDSFYSGKEANLNRLKSDGRFRLLKGDILDGGVLDSAFKGADIVFHLAAQAGVRYCIEHPERAHAVNATGTLNMLMSARKMGVKKVVYASSSSVYGDPQKIPMDEDHPQRPTNPYAASKLAAEKYCLAFSRSYNMDITSLRFFSVYGPRGRPDQVVTSFANSVSHGIPPTIYGDGSYSRDFTYVSDVVDATVLSAMASETGDHVLNIGYGKDVKIAYVAKRILEHYGSKFGPKFLEGYNGDFARTICSNLRAQKLLRWTPRISFDEGLSRYLEWYDSARQVRGVLGGKAQEEGSP